MNKLLVIFSVFLPFGSFAAIAQVQGFSIVKPVGAPSAVLTLPGSARRLVLNCASGCSSTRAASWDVSSTTGGASATLAPSPSGNYVDVTVGSVGGGCPIVAASGAYAIPAASTVTLKATSKDDPTKWDTLVLDVCSPAIEASTIPFYRVLYSGQREDVQGVVWGSANTSGTWAIITQPASGDGLLDDTRFQDTVFHATVKGLYKVRWTSSADASKTAYSTFYVTGNTAPRKSQPNGTEPIDCTADPNATGGVLEVGPTQTFANLKAIAPGKIVPGVTIRVHNEDTSGSNPTTYHEWMQINGAGAHDNPIRMCGVPDSLGNLPVLDGQNATARADVLSAAYVSGIAGIMVYNTNYDPYPAYNGPQYVVVEGLALRNYSPVNSYVPAGQASGAVQYNVGASGFRFQVCRDCEFNGSEVYNNGNGIFAESNDARAWGGVSERLLFEGNNVHDNGVANDSHEHNLYLQAWYQVVQFNQMPTYNTAAQGSQYKDRGSSWFRYNYVGTGAARMMDLVEDQDAPNYLSPNVYLTSMRVLEPRDAYTGDQLAAAQEMWHHSQIVYGNIFAQANSGAVHFAADNLGGYTGRVGTLEFYNNTLNAVVQNMWRYSWFDTGDNGSGYLHYEWPVINVANIAADGWKSNQNPYFSWNSQRDAFMNFGKVLVPATWGTNDQNCTDNSVGACDGSGWPFQSNLDVYFNGNQFNATGTYNLVLSTVSPEFDTTTFQLTNSVTGIALTGAQANLPVRFQYVPQGGYAAPRSTVVTDSVGGTIGGTDPVPSGNSVPPSEAPTGTVTKSLPTAALKVVSTSAGTAAGNTFWLSSSSASTGAVKYSVASGPGDLNQNTLLISSAGTVVLNAQQAATSTYAAGQATLSITWSGLAVPVSSPSTLKVPTLNIYTTAATTAAGKVYWLSPNSNSSSPVSLTILSGPGFLNQNTLMLSGAGTVVIKAQQSASSTFAAGSATISITGPASK